MAKVFNKEAKPGEIQPSFVVIRNLISKQFEERSDIIIGRSSFNLFKEIE
jgi:hypothetical protein